MRFRASFSLVNYGPPRTRAWISNARGVQPPHQRWRLQVCSIGCVEGFRHLSGPARLYS
jgi:hypothetical protein